MLRRLSAEEAPVCKRCIPHDCVICPDEFRRYRMARYVRDTKLLAEVDLVTEAEGT